ncbi:hypothetical protein Tco_1035176, partial [Tanacetum coccineum]
KQVAEGEKDKKSYDDVNDSNNRLEPGSHQEIVPHLADRATDDVIANNLKPSIPATIIEDCDAF